MAPEDARPSPFEAAAAGVAGIAFAVLALAVRSATVLPAGFFDAAAALCAGIGLAPLAHRRLGAPAGTLARGAGPVAAALLVCAALVAPFDRAAVPVALWLAGGALLQAGAKERRSAAVLASLGLVLLLAGSASAWVLAAGFPDPARLRAAVLLATGLWLAGLGARAFARRSRWAAWAPMPLGILLVVAVGCVYVAYRPLVALRVANLPLYEWTLGVSAALLLLGRMRRQARDDAVPEAWSSEARRHRQDALPAYDPRMAPVAAALSRYLERGEGFEEYRAALARAGGPEPYRKALQGLRPVQGRARGKDAALARQKAHDDLMAMLDTEVSHGHAPPALR